jgi:putative hydrolase of the HAD superfamily
LIRTFVFDLGGVIVRFSHERMFRQMAAVCGYEAGDLERQLVDNDLLDRFERGKMREADFHREVENLVGQSVDRDRLLRAASDIFEPDEKMGCLIAWLKEAGYRLVLLSNTCVSHFEHLRRHLPVLDRFDARVLSYEVGAKKPEAAIFAAVLAAVGCPPENCFYVDDIPAYVAAGRRFGLRCEVFRGADAFVRQLAELQVLLNLPDFAADWPFLA